MERDEMLEFWNAMAKEGNWVPSWTDSLNGLSAEEAAWTPSEGGHCIWQELAHVIFWRQVTIRKFAGGPSPTGEEVEKYEFALPEKLDEESWRAAVAAFNTTQEEIAAAIQNPEIDCHRVPYHVLHDAYHLGRITQLRAMRGVAPKF